MEAVRLRVKDIDFARNEITVRDGKGEQDRLTMLPRALKDPLARQVAAVHRLHEEDLKRGYGAVYLPYLWNENTKTQRRILSGNICFPQTSFRLIHVQRK